MSNQPLIEACVDSFESCKAAFENDADRLELCGNLSVGGTTPSLFTAKEVKKVSDVKMNVLIRPRFGDFLYTNTEVEQMIFEIKQFADIGVNGVVIGALTPEGRLDCEVMKRMMEAAKGLDVTLHRAFDMSRDPLECLEDAISLGVKTILTSGQHSTVVEGKEVLKTVFDAAKGRIDIMAGCGVKKHNIQMLHDYTGINIFHTTGQVAPLDSGMIYRKENVSMGLPSLSEYSILRTSPEEFKLCADIVHSF